ncbi:hypothetical protein [Pseudomonas viridiflava]|uniref:hypothetical protein n=1 Tax=Pseudomonas viridiflava TaxID=33069 RepID=UPI0013C2CAE5|nr:hypothetical protein [Pseudomonas viridiflava]
MITFKTCFSLLAISLVREGFVSRFPSVTVVINSFIQGSHAESRHRFGLARACLKNDLDSNRKFKAMIFGPDRRFHEVKRWSCKGVLVRRVVTVAVSG